jgi:hypothetical protein
MTTLILLRVGRTAFQGSPLVVLGERDGQPVLRPQPRE